MTGTGKGRVFENACKAQSQHANTVTAGLPLGRMLSWVCGSWSGGGEVFTSTGMVGKIFART